VTIERCWLATLAPGKYMLKSRDGYHLESNDHSNGRIHGEGTRGFACKVRWPIQHRGGKSSCNRDAPIHGGPGPTAALRIAGSERGAGAGKVCYGKVTA